MNEDIKDLCGVGIVVDVDGTIAADDSSLGYHERRPIVEVINRINRLKKRGARIIIYTARNMRTFEGNVGLINLHTLPTLLDWLTRNGVCHDEVYVGKPWCGPNGLYAKKNAMRPSAFTTLEFDDLVELLKDLRTSEVGD